ncbi:MAG TPA: response regulator, partial [Bryobacteraceae bacterium]|nr:response regulator [Bryobacteraceae bacterium]
INVLIVDDSSSIRRIVQRILQQTGLPFATVFEAADGQQALELLGREREIRLILSDINMPNMDGIALLRTIRESAEWRDVPVILITTEGTQNRVKEAAALGATSYIHKPFNADDLKYKLLGLLKG